MMSLGEGESSLELVDSDGGGDLFLMISLVIGLTRWLLADWTVLGLLFGSERQQDFGENGY